MRDGNFEKYFSTIQACKIEGVPDVPDTTPAVSVGLCYLTTAGLLSTAFVSGVLTVSSTILAAVGALSNGEPGSIRNDPSRNFLVRAVVVSVSVSVSARL